MGWAQARAAAGRGDGRAFRGRDLDDAGLGSLRPQSAFAASVQRLAVVRGGTCGRARRPLSTVLQRHIALPIRHLRFPQYKVARASVHGRPAGRGGGGPGGPWKHLGKDALQVREQPIAQVFERGSVRGRLRHELQRVVLAVRVVEGLGQRLQTGRVAGSGRSCALLSRPQSHSGVARPAARCGAPPSGGRLGPSLPRRFASAVLYA